MTTELQTIPNEKKRRHLKKPSGFHKEMGTWDIKTKYPKVERSIMGLSTNKRVARTYFKTSES